MSITWDDPVRFSWDSSQLLVGRPMTLGTAIDYFAPAQPAAVPAVVQLRSA